MQLSKLFLIGLFISTATCAQAQADFVAPSMVSIPAGKFIMGRETSTGGQFLNSPAHEVKINAFQLSQYEVTVGEFRKFATDTKHQAKTQCWRQKKGANDIERAPGSWDSPQYAPSEFHPVMCIGRDDALAYAAWLSKKTGDQYRLPSEAEWEYAARAGSKDEYFFGNDAKKLCQYANVFDQSGARAFKKDLGRESIGIDCDDRAAYTSTVGMYLANQFGLFDMIGNVGEFTADCEHLNYVGAPTDGSAWITGCTNRTLMGPMIVHRGGTYASDAAASGIFARRHAGETNPSSLGEGFRLARHVAPVRPNLVSNTQAFLKDLTTAQAAVRQSLTEAKK